MDDPPHGPLIRYAVPPDQWSAEMIAALTDDEFDDFIADIFEGFPDDDETEVNFEEGIRQAEEDIAAGMKTWRDVLETTISGYWHQWFALVPIFSAHAKP